VGMDAQEQSIVRVSPFRCRVWSLHDRADEYITEASCREEIASFEKHGQLVPVLGRPLHKDPAHDVELIYGARRLFVARHLNVPLRVELRDMTDREAIIAMDIENRQRKDISPYERGSSYARWLREGLFSSQDDIANALKVSASQVSRLLKVARLPPVMLSAFETPSDICEGWGLELAMALEDPRRREQTIRKAREIGRSPHRPGAREISRQLLAASARGRKPLAKKHDEVVLDNGGPPLFRIRYDRTTVLFVLPVQSVSARCLNDLRNTIAKILQGGKPEPHDFPTKKAGNSRRAGSGLSVSGIEL
jgi:ParB/RepB/Spo0J family partition protein